MHYVGPIEESLFSAPPSHMTRAEGFRRAGLLHRAQGTVHMGYSVAELQPGGRVDPRFHAYEKGVYVTEGEAELNRDGKACRLGPGDYALVPAGAAHAWRNRGGKRARWVEMCAPQPKPSSGWPDTFFPGALPWPAEVPAPPFGDPSLRGIGHFDWSQIPPPAFVHPNLHGFSRRMLMDRPFGSQQFDMFMVQFAGGGLCNHHDHPFEEAYLMLEGEVGFAAEGKEYVLRPGDIAWTGVGAVHAFFPDRGMAARWLEVMAPQPPDQNAIRFYAPWDHLRTRPGLG